jgi:hypothetical protein
MPSNLWKKSIWYSNVLIELLQVVIITSQRSEKCLRKFDLLKKFFKVLFGIDNLQLFQPIL